MATVVSPEFLGQVCDNLNVGEMFEILKSVECSSRCEIGKYRFCVDISDAGLNCF